MTSFDTHDPAFVSAYDDASVWSAMAGQLLLDHLPMSGGQKQYDRILDVGCGTGFPLIELAGRLGPNCKVTGIDSWTEAVDRAREKIKAWRLSNADIVVGDAATMDFEDATFDLIVSNLGINNFTDPITTLAVCARVLKPGGSLALTTNLQGHMSAFYDALRASLQSANQNEALANLEDHIATRHSKTGVIALLEDAGFSVEVTELKTCVLRYASWNAFWTHPFVDLAFKGPWLDIMNSVHDNDILSSVKQIMDQQVEDEGELRLAVPFAYIEARLA